MDKRKVVCIYQKGFTLIELLIVSSLILTVLSVGYSIYIMGLRGFAYDASALENQSNVRIAMNHISRNIRSSNKVELDGGSLKVGLDTYRLVGGILRVNHNQLALGISEFSVSKPYPHLVYIRIESMTDTQGNTFALEAWFSIRRV